MRVAGGNTGAIVNRTGRHLNPVNMVDMADMVGWVMVDHPEYG